MSWIKVENKKHNRTWVEVVKVGSNTCRPPNKTLI